MRHPPSHMHGRVIIHPRRGLLLKRLTVLPRRKAAVAPRVAPIESATNPTGNPKR